MFAGVVRQVEDESRAAENGLDRERGGGAVVGRPAEDASDGIQLLD